MANWSASAFVEDAVHAVIHLASMAGAQDFITRGPHGHVQ